MEEFGDLRRAFPLAQSIPGSVVQGGMSLRDYFAAKAMQSLTCNPVAVKERWHSVGGNEEELLKSVAKAAYKMADAMMVASGE